MVNFTKQSRSSFVNELLGLNFKSTQGKYSFCSDEKKIVLFGLDISNDNEEKNLILSPDWNKRQVTHSMGHINKVLDEGYELMIYFTKTDINRNGKTVLVGYSNEIEKRKLVEIEGGQFIAEPLI